MRELTRNQSLVLNALQADRQPASAYTLLDRLRGDGFKAPLQVYRALEKLIERGQVHRLESLNAFVACQHEGCNSHSTAAFLICDHCKSVTEFDPVRVRRAITQGAKDVGFTVRRSVIEVEGSCGDCAAEADS